MLSRVAENAFWMSRYMERTNAQLRILRTYYIASQDGIPFVQWDEVYSYYNKGRLPEAQMSLNKVLDFVLFDRENEPSVANNIFRARENARSAQDHITKELWQCLNDYYHLVRDSRLQKEIANGDPIHTFDELIRQCMLYYGVVDISMFRSEGFNYLNIGKYIERILQSISALRQQMTRTNGKVNNSVDIVSWRYFLISMSGYEFYLKSNSGSVVPDLIYNQVLRELHFPHSVAYCLQQIDRYAQRLKQESKEENFSRIDFAIGKAIAGLKYTAPGKDCAEQMLFLQTLEQNVLDIVQAFNQNYFGISS